MTKYTKKFNKKYDPTFAASVTSMAFSLNLSRNMIMRLVEIKNRSNAYIDIFRGAGLSYATYESSCAILRRGLLRKGPPDAPGLYTLTRAGELVYELLEIAGLTVSLTGYMSQKEKEKI